MHIAVSSQSLGCTYLTRVLLVLEAGFSAVFSRVRMMDGRRIDFGMSEISYKAVQKVTRGPAETDRQVIKDSIYSLTFTERGVSDGGAGREINELEKG